VIFFDHEGFALLEAFQKGRREIEVSAGDGVHEVGDWSDVLAGKV